MLASVPATELTEWVAYFRLEEERREEAKRDAAAEQQAKKWHTKRRIK